MTDKRLQYLTVVCFHILLAFVPVYFRFTTEELFEFNKLLAVYTLTAVIGGLWVSRMIVNGHALWKRTVFDGPVAFFLASQILSTVFSIHPRTSLYGYYTRFHGGLLSYIVYIFLYYAAVNTLEKKHIKPLLITALSSASFVAVYGILEHFGHSPSCLLITNGASFDASCWIQDVQSRVFATFGQPNWLAAYMVMLWPTAAWLTTVQKKSPKTWQLLGLTAWTLASIVLLYTKSRSGFLGLGAGVGVYMGMRGGSWIWAHGWQLNHIRAQFRNWHLSFFAVGFALQVGLFALLGTPFSASLPSLVSPRPATEADPVVAEGSVDRLEAGGTDSGEIRKIVWTGALGVWKRYPILGSGVETFAYSYYRDRPKAHNDVSEWDFLYNKAHNEVLNFLATTGLVGVVSYLLLIAWFVISSWKIAISTKHTEQEQLLAISLSSGLIAVFVSNFFGFSTVMVTVLWFLFQACIAVLLPVAPEKTDASSPPLSGVTWFGLSLTWFSVATALILIYNMYAADMAFALGKSYFSSGAGIQGSQSLQRAISLAPREALYYDELAHTLAKMAIDAATNNDATMASKLASSAVELSDTALTLNPVHLNFFKTRARIFITLAQLKPELLEDAKEALLAALERSPTDAKLVYNLALVEMGLGNTNASITYLEQAVALKPNYGAARLELAKAYMLTDATSSAQTQLEYILQYINPGDTQSTQLLEQIATSAAQTKKP